MTDAIAAGGTPEGTLPTGDALRLLRAWASLRGGDVLAADLTLTADCGPLVLRDTVQYDRRTVSGLDFSCVRPGQPGRCTSPAASCAMRRDAPSPRATALRSSPGS